MAESTTYWGHHRVPQNIAPFNNYITSTNTFLQSTDPNTGNPRWMNYPGVTSQNATDWAAYASKWGGDYLLYQNPDTRTKTVNKNIHDDIVNFTEFAMPILNLIAANPNGTNQDEVVFNLVLDKNHKDPTKKENPIEGECFAHAESLGGGEIKIGCRTEHDASRNSLAEGADSVQVAYKIGAPFTIDEYPETYRTHLFSTASFILRVNSSAEGQKLYLRLRWYNLKHQSLAGSWSEVMYQLIIT